MNLPLITLKTTTHNTLNVVQLHFEKNDALLQVLRSFKTLRWSKTMQCWYLPYENELKNKLFNLLQGKAWLDYHALNQTLKLAPVEIKTPNYSSKPHSEKTVSFNLPALSKEGEEKLQHFKNWLNSKRYSQSTIGTYTDALKTFLRFYSHKTIAEITNEDIINFNNEYILKQKLSASFQNQIVNAIKLFIRIIENKHLNPELIHRPKRQKLLPNVLSKEEIKLILNSQSNLKHKTMLSLIYSCGLRRSELLNLKLTQIDWNRNLLIIKQSKGRKDRIVPLSYKTGLLVKDYLEVYKPNEWVFEGQDRSSQYDESSLAAVLKQALEKCKITKPVTLHWLRHSYATHLLENGTDLRYIQEILGHSRSTITEIYTHVSNKSIQRIVSPFDNL
ncbi:MAG: site-specific integrase [Bacteroidota bacterium]|nr:site-specific integrase [Bacteroidota bacterium]